MGEHQSHTASPEHLFVHAAAAAIFHTMRCANFSTPFHRRSRPAAFFFFFSRYLFIIYECSAVPGHTFDHQQILVVVFLHPNASLSFLLVPRPPSPVPTHAPSRKRSKSCLTMRPSFFVGNCWVSDHMIVYPLGRYQVFATPWYLLVFTPSPPLEPPTVRSHCSEQHDSP